MLNENRLYQEIKQALHETVPSTFEHAFRTTFPTETSIGDDVAKKYYKSIDEALCDPLAKRLASIIDYYIRNADIYGTIITTGSPVTQTAIINSPNPLTNGKIPNTLGII